MRKQGNWKDFIKGAGRGVQLLLAVLLAGVSLVAAPPTPVHAASFVVNSAGNQPDANPGDGTCKIAGSNLCTLRAAIMETNALPGPDTITFNPGLTNIIPASPLPPLTDGGTTIRGDNDIALVGNSLSLNDAAITIQSSGNAIQGLLIRNFVGSGIYIDGTNQAAPANGNIIGTDGDGITDGGLERNIIRNNGVGIYIVGQYADSNVIAGNNIGTNAAGTLARPNGAGILITSGQGITLGVGPTLTRIGTNSDGVSDLNERNLISGNQQHGIYMVGASSLTTIAGNYIGTDVTGSSAIGNKVGIDVSFSIGVDIGRNNLISGNTWSGILISKSAALVRGNMIGTDASGTAALGNGEDGIYILNPFEVTIGTKLGKKDAAAERNIISGNGLSGVHIWGDDGATIRVSGNYIGTDVTGAAPLGNVQHGVFIDDSDIPDAWGPILIGSDEDGKEDSGERNVISANGESGIWITESDSLVRIAGNYIGTDASGANALGNPEGIYAERGRNVYIGKSNVISGNQKSGVRVNFIMPVIAGNLIGTDATGTKVLGNGGDGVFLEAGVLVTVGLDGENRDGESERNVISGNAQNGIRVEDGYENWIAGNYIGTDISGNKALGNGEYGIYVSGSDKNQIGKLYSLEIADRNVISGNQLGGIYLTESQDNNVDGNYIGLAANAETPLGNGGNGVWVPLDSGSYNYNLVWRNWIAHNEDHGVQVEAKRAVVLITGNKIYENGKLGIELGSDGVTANDYLDKDTGPNYQLNYPEILSAVTDGSTISIQAQLVNGRPKDAFYFNFFASPTCDPSGYGEGQFIVGGTLTEWTDANGNVTFTYTGNYFVPPVGYYITVLSELRDTNEVSEFSKCFQLVEGKIEGR